MLQLLLLVLEVGVHQCSANDTPFVINRITNRVEFSDLLLEYNHNHADDRSVEVTISLAIRHIYVYAQAVSLSCEIYQQWRDSRLKYSGSVSTTIPEDIKIWMPDTSFINCGVTYGMESSLRLYTDGIICRKQRAILALPCVPVLSSKGGNQQLNCSLIIGSFDNVGTGSIIYSVGNVTVPGELDQSAASRLIGHTYITFHEEALNGESLSRTAIHFFIESNEIARLLNRTELESELL